MENLSSAVENSLGSKSGTDWASLKRSFNSTSALWLFCAASRRSRARTRRSARRAWADDGTDESRKAVAEPAEGAQSLAGHFVRPTRRGSVAGQGIALGLNFRRLLDGFRGREGWQGFEDVVRRGSLQQPSKTGPAVDEILRGGILVDELPAYLPQRGGLADEPRLGAVAVLFGAPVFGFGDALAIEFEDQLGVAGFEQRGGYDLVAGDAGVGGGRRRFWRSRIPAAVRSARV